MTTYKCKTCGAFNPLGCTECKMYVRSVYQIATKDVAEAHVKEIAEKYRAEDDGLYSWEDYQKE